MTTRVSFGNPKRGLRKAAMSRNTTCLAKSRSYENEPRNRFVCIKGLGRGSSILDASTFADKSLMRIDAGILAPIQKG